jgi:2-polyprenyl-3-methyl-5-hydroxy-6-metoxy-1,4-benzoquinol methylase
MASSPEDQGIPEADNLEQVLCDLCGADAGLPIYRVRDRLDPHQSLYQFVRCQTCGLLYVSPRPKVPTLSGYYPAESYYAYRRLQPMGYLQRLRTRLKEWLAVYLRGYPPAGHKGGTWNLKRGTPLWLSPLDGLLWAVPSYRPGGRLLDVGCGSGLYLRAMRRLGWQVAGVEMSSIAVAHARESLGLDVKEGSLEEARYPDAYFDVVTMWHVLEHLPSPRRALKEVARVLKPGGILLCEVPNERSLQSRVLGSRWFHLDPPRHLYAFSPATVRRAVQAAGLTILSVAQVPSLVGWTESLLALWRPFAGSSQGLHARCRWLLRFGLALWEYAAAHLGHGGLLRLTATKNDEVQQQ